MRKLIVLMLIVSINAFASWSTYTSTAYNTASITYTLDEYSVHIRQNLDTKEFLFEISFADKSHHLSKYDDFEVHMSCTDAIPIVLNNVIDTTKRTIQFSLTDEDASKLRDLFYTAASDSYVSLLLYKDGRAMIDTNVYGSGFKTQFRKAFGAKGN